MRAFLPEDSGMRFLGALLSILLLSLALDARVERNTHHSTADPSYSSALQAADRFLHAWQTQDHEAGIMMLSDRARQRVSPEQLQQFFSPAASAGYEIAHGRLRRSGTYEFPVVLFGTTTSSRHAYFSRIVIVRAGKDDWMVERLP